MNIIIHGMIEKICCCIGSICAGFSLNWKYMLMPSSSASTPIPRKDGGVKGSRPNRFRICSGSGADKSLIHSTNG